tara:strand:+ start:523 stop:906 length:384 start_codon:yes stop_codon:yes gene_type:complete
MSNVDIDTLYTNFDTYTVNDRHKLLKTHNLSGDTNKKLDKMNEIHKNDIHYKSLRHLSLLTLISLVSFPIVVITGYFGMNFKYMGSPVVGNNNILSIKSPNIKVILLCSVISVIIIYYYIEFDVGDT